MWRGPRITPCPRNTATAEAHDQCPVMEWSGRAAAPPEREAGNGLAIEGAQPCPTNQSRPLPPWASILARIRSTSSALIDAARSCCGRSGHAGQVEARIANMPPCLIGMEACVGAHHLSRKLHAHGHDARLMPAKYVRAYSKGQKNDFRDAEAIAEAVQRPTMKFVATKTADQLDLQALHRVRERLVSQRTGITVAAIGTGDVFAKGRDFAAWLGLVPQQVSTGDSTILGKISKRGNRYLRVLFVQ